MKRLILSLAPILLFASSAFAQIEGRVTDAKGKGLPKVTITATGADGTVASTTTTDEDGEYAFEDLDSGNYKITAKGTAAFQPAVRENVSVAEDETTTLDIALLPAVPTRPGMRPSPPRTKQIKLYVANLSFQTSSEDLQELFSQAGTVECASVVEDKDTGRSKGFGFVVMATREEGEAAIQQFNGKEFGGRSLNVNEARPGSPSGGKLNCSN